MVFPKHEPPGWRLGKIFLDIFEILLASFIPYEGDAFFINRVKGWQWPERFAMNIQIYEVCLVDL